MSVPDPTPTTPETTAPSDPAQTPSSATRSLMASVGAWRREGKRQDTLGKAAMRLSFEALKARPTLLAWCAGAEVALGAMSLALLSGLLAPLAADFPGLNDGLIGWASRALIRMQTPRFILGATGLIATITFSRLLLKSWIDAGVFSYLERQLDLSGEPSASARFSALAKPWLVRSMLWRLMRALLRAGVGLLGVMVYVSLLIFNATSGPVTSSLVTGLIYAGLFIFTLPMLAMIELVPALQAARSRSLGEALLDGLALSVNAPGALLRIVSLSALIISLPGLLWGLSNVAAAMVTQPEAALMVSTIRVGAELLLWGAVAAAALIFRGATFSLVALEDGLIEPLADEELATSRFWSMRRAGAQTITRADFIPDALMAPTNIFSIQHVLERDALKHEQEEREDAEQEPAVIQDEDRG